MFFYNKHALVNIQAFGKSQKRLCKPVYPSFLFPSWKFQCFHFWVKWPLKNLKLCFCCDEPVGETRPLFVCTVFHILCQLCPNCGIKR